MNNVVYLTPGNTEDKIEAFERLLHRHSMKAISDAEALLRKLNVRELRVLMAHYCKGRPEDYSDLRKADLIGEIAPLYADDQGWLY